MLQSTNTKRPFSWSRFMKGGGIVAVLFVCIIAFAKIYQGSDKKYEIQQRTHYQDGIDRTVICESPAQAFQYTPAIGWILGILALAAITYLLYLLAIDRAPDWFEKRSIAVTLITLGITTAFLFGISSYGGAECLTIPYTEFKQALDANDLPGLFKNK